MLEEKFSDLLTRLKFDDEIYELIVRALRESQTVERQDHKAAMIRLRSEIDRLSSRLEAVYIDKLDGAVTDEFYRRVSAQWRDELDRCQRDMTRQLEAGNAYMDEGVALLTLARKAYSLFDSACAIEKRRLLNFVLSNCIWQHGELRAEYRQPFDMLIGMFVEPDPTDGGGGSYRTLCAAPDADLLVRLEEIRRDEHGWLRAA